MNGKYGGLESGHKHRLGTGTQAEEIGHRRQTFVNSQRTRKTGVLIGNIRRQGHRSPQQAEFGVEEKEKPRWLQRHADLSLLSLKGLIKETQVRTSKRKKKTGMEEEG